MTPLSVRNIIAVIAAGAVTTTAASAKAASFGNPDELPWGAIDANAGSRLHPGPRNPALTSQFPNATNPPAMVVGDMPLFCASFINARKRIQNGRWARHVTQAYVTTSDAVSRVSTRVLSSGIAIFAGIARVALARTGAVLLLSGLATCAGSPATLALQPDFEVMTPAGVASVSVRQPLSEMTEAQFSRLVAAGMMRVDRDNVISGRVEPPAPSQRIVWHDNMSPSRGMSLLVVNVFDGAAPYAYELATVPNGAPTVVITSAIERMSERLLADITAHANMSNRRGGKIARNETNQLNLSQK